MPDQPSQPPRRRQRKPSHRVFSWRYAETGIVCLAIGRCTDGCCRLAKITYTGTPPPPETCPLLRHWLASVLGSTEFLGREDEAKCIVLSNGEKRVTLTPHNPSTTP